MANLSALAFAALLGPTNLGPLQVLVLVPCTAIWIWALADCATKEPETGNSKVVWVIIIALTSVMGAALYLAIRRPQRRAQFGR